MNRVRSLNQKTRKPMERLVMWDVAHYIKHAFKGQKLPFLTQLTASPTVGTIKYVAFIGWRFMREGIIP